jgi:hypothetical protein
MQPVPHPLSQHRHLLLPSPEPRSHVLDVVGVWAVRVGRERVEQSLVQLQHALTEGDALLQCSNQLGALSVIHV